MRALLTITLALAVFLPACDRNTEPFVPGEEPRQPDLARIFPAPAESNNGNAGGRASAPSTEPGARRGTAPMPSPANAAAPAGESGSSTQSITGTIRVAPELQAAAPPGGMLFVIARAAGITRGPPLAVLRIPSPSFPLSFTIGPQNVMIPSMRFEGQIQLTARLDGDGNAMTKLPGDLSGTASSPHPPSTTGVELTLDKRL